MVKCNNCEKTNDNEKYYCQYCGEYLNNVELKYKEVTKPYEFKLKRILENLQYTPHNPILWNDIVDVYTKNIEKYKAIYNIEDLHNSSKSLVVDKMNDFLELCYKADFQIAFVGTIKTGKSTLINSLLGKNYASMAVTPETAALTKFRSSPKDYVKVVFYNIDEWKELWKSMTSAAGPFKQEYEALGGDKVWKKWIGHETIYKELSSDSIKDELSIWSSSQHAEHYFVKEIEVGISTLPTDFPKQVVFVDTPGLSDPVQYRSNITKEYIKKANAVFVCVDAQKTYREEIETIASVFSFSSNNKEKVHIIATHWDVLNKPVEDWKIQKNYLLKQLVGPAFFDNTTIADKNITFSSAYYFNLCRDYSSISNQEIMNLALFALKLQIISPEQLGNAIKDMNPFLLNIMELSNIKNIYSIIRDRLISNYKSLLCSDIKSRYEDIIFDLSRAINDNQKEIKDIIKLKDMSLKEQKEQLQTLLDNKLKIERTENELKGFLKAVDDKTKSNFLTISSILSNMQYKQSENYINTKKKTKGVDKATEGEPLLKMFKFFK